MSVSTTPVPFAPGGIGTVTMTVYNTGPETAVSTLPNQRSIIVYEKPYDVVGRPPPFAFFEPAAGCSAYAEFSEYIPGLPGGGITLLHSYYFDSIAPGESRTCTYRIEFLPTTQENFATYWDAHTTNDDDVNPDNDRFDYAFVAAPAGAPSTVPASSDVALMMLSVGLLASVASARRRRASRIARGRNGG